MSGGFTGESLHESQAKVIATHRTWIGKLKEKDGVLEIVGDGRFRSVKKVTKAGAQDQWALPMSKVSVHYTGWVVDCGDETPSMEDALKKRNPKPFDSSLKRGPFSFTLRGGQVIPGWDYGVATMNIGEECYLLLAPEHGYGQSGAPPVIPPNSFLLFHIQLLECQQPSKMNTPQIIAFIFTIIIALYYIVLRRTSSDSSQEPDL